MSTFNRLLGSLFDGLLMPFRGLPPLVGLAVISLVTSILMLLAFRLVSNQAALMAVKRLIHAGVFEIRLFKDDLRAIFRAQRDILRHTGRYVRLSMVPMLWMVVPFVFLVGQLQSRYGYSGLEPGSTAIVKATLREASETGEEVSLEPTSGIRVDSPLLWIPSSREANWRIRVEEPGDHLLRVRVGEAVFTKLLRTSGEVVRRAPVRPSGLLDQLLYPAERPLSGDAPVKAIAVTYPAGTVNLLGWRTHWLVAYMAMTLVFAFALQRPLKVSL